MIVVISPAKSLDVNPSNGSKYTTPAFTTEANKLVRQLKKLTVHDLKEMMQVSDKLATENFLRYKNFKQRLPLPLAKRALEIFTGDVYRGLNAGDFDAEDYEWSQEHLRILSGLYGVLRPLDLIQPYRLEMGTRLSTDKGRNLYEYWGNKITRQINKAIADSQSDILVNLASEEYFRSIKKNKLKAEVLHINFKEYHDGSLKFLSFPAKVARGMMARFIIKNRLEKIEDIKGFDREGYKFSEDLSASDKWIFIR